MQAAFCSPAPLSTRHTASLSCHRRPRRARTCACSELDEPTEPTALSRRVFNAGILASAISTSWVGYRIIVGDDLKSRGVKLLRSRFPTLFPRESTPDERRGEADAVFARAYFDSLADSASELGIITKAELHSEEGDVQLRSRTFFFPNDEKAPFPRVTDPRWLNFALYARLHVIAMRTSPKQRASLTAAVAARTLPLLGAPPAQHSAAWARDNASVWLADVEALLDRLVSIGWISGYNISDFDSSAGSAWLEDGRAALTVYARDPLTIQAAQLIGEEQSEEISPKITAWIRLVLEAAGITVSSEDYYLDDTYRPDPADFTPSQLATEFDLSL